MLMICAAQRGNYSESIFLMLFIYLLMNILFTKRPPLPIQLFADRLTVVDEPISLKHFIAGQDVRPFHELARLVGLLLVEYKTTQFVFCGARVH